MNAAEQLTQELTTPGSGALSKPLRCLEHAISDRVAALAAQIAPSIYGQALDQLDAEQKDRIWAAAGRGVHLFKLWGAL